MLAFEELVKENKDLFIKRVNLMAAHLGTNPNFLMSVMKAESGLNPAAQNLKFPLQGGPATGLIQFTPDTAQSLGTSIAELKNMSNVRQLDYVEDFFRPYQGKLKSYFDVYTSVFFPAAVGKPDNWVFETKNIKRSSVARQNPVMDANKDGKITVAEFKQYLENTIPARLKNLVFTVTEAVKNNPALTVMALIAAYMIFFKGK